MSVQADQRRGRQDNVIVVDSVERLFQSSAGLFSFRPAPPIRAVDGVSFSIERGSCFAIVGESGSGKSTLARIIVGLLAPTEGVVLFDGRSQANKSEAEKRKMRRKVQLVLQDPHASLDPRMSIYSILREALVVHGLHLGREAQQRRIEATIRQVGLGIDHLHRYPNELSGGQRQRVAIARAIICEPEVIVLDEPVSALDVSIQAQIVNLLVELQDTLNLTYVIISHDLSLVGHMADSLGVMYLGRLVEIGSTRAICAKPLHPYTESLLSVVASHDPRIERTRSIEILQGSVPNAAAIPSGCPFHTRCPRARKLSQTMTEAETAESENARVPTVCATDMPDARRDPLTGVTVTCHFAELSDADPNGGSSLPYCRITTLGETTP